MTRRIMIVGAGGGIGQVLAEMLITRGDRVVACARQAEQLSVLAGMGCETKVMDVADGASVRAAFSAIGQLDAVVNCAALAPLGTVEFTDPERVAAVINTNTLGSLRIMQAALPVLRDVADGRLVLVSSLWGRLSGPFVSSYAASKHALEALVDSARREMGRGGVAISLIEPGVVKTAMYYDQLPELDRTVAALDPREAQLYARQYAHHRQLVAKAGDQAITARDCAKAILRCLDARHPKPRYRVGTDARVMIALSRILSDRALDRVFGLMYKG